MLWQLINRATPKLVGPVCALSLCCVSLAAQLNLTGEMKNRGANLSWTLTDVRAKSVGFTIYRQSGGTTKHWRVTGNAYRDTDLEKNVTYEYWILAQQGRETFGTSNHIRLSATEGGHGPTLLTDAAVVVGIALAAVLLDQLFRHHDSPEKSLDKNGPQLPATFTSNDIRLAGFVKGGWPVIVDYELRRPANVFIEANKDGVDPLNQALDGSEGRHIISLTLPANFGNKAVAGTLHLHADESGESDPTPLLLLHGISCGITNSPPMTSSGPFAFDDGLGVSDIVFSSENISIRHAETSAYSMIFNSDFKKASAEFLQYSLEGDTVSSKPVKADSLSNTDHGQTLIEAPPWDGKVKKQPKFGVFRLSVRAWLPGASEGWLVGFSDNLLTVGN